MTTSTFVNDIFDRILARIRSFVDALYAGWVLLTSDPDEMP